MVGWVGLLGPGLLLAWSRMGEGRLAIACEKRKEEKRRVGMGDK